MKQVSQIPVRGLTYMRYYSVVYSITLASLGTYAHAHITLNTPGFHSRLVPNNKLQLLTEGIGSVVVEAGAGLEAGWKVRKL